MIAPCDEDALGEGEGDREKGAPGRTGYVTLPVLYNPPSFLFTLAILFSVYPFLLDPVVIEVPQAESYGLGFFPYFEDDSLSWAT